MIKNVDIYCYAALQNNHNINFIAQY